MDRFPYDKDLRHERVNALLLACIHRDIFLDYETKQSTYMHPNIQGGCFQLII